MSFFGGQLMLNHPGDPKVLMFGHNPRLQQCQQKLQPRPWVLNQRPARINE